MKWDKIFGRRLHKILSLKREGDGKRAKGQGEHEFLRSVQALR
jgi:hypothetical protein